MICEAMAWPTHHGSCVLAMLQAKKCHDKRTIRRKRIPGGYVETQEQGCM